MNKLNFPSEINQQEYTYAQKTNVDDEIIVLPDIKHVPLFPKPFSPQFGSLTFCKKGWMKGKYNMHEIKVSAGDVTIIPKYAVVTFEEVSPDFEATTILFPATSNVGDMIGKRRPAKYLIELYHNPIVTPDPDIWPIVLKGVSMLIDISNHPSIPNKLELMEQIFTTNFNMVYKSKLYKAKTGIVKSRAEHLFEVFSDEVTSRVSQSHRVDFFADLLCITPNYLSKVCQHVAGISASDYINSCIIMQSQYLLLNNKDLTIQQISDQMGFNNQSFFAKFFKQHVGISPSDYRKQEQVVALK